MKVTVESGDPRSLRLLEENARYMRHEQFANLVANVRRDGVLTSLPFVWEDDEGVLHVLSGNHRVMAAVEAGLTEIRWLQTSDDLNLSQRLAIQLSHNAIVGEDDASVLTKLYQQIDDMEMKHYSGLDDRSLELLRDAQVASVTEPNLEYQVLSYVFLPGDGDRVMEIFEEASKLAQKASETWLVRYEDHFRLLQAVEEASAAHDVRNRSAALTYVLDVYERHREELQEGYVDEHGEAKHGRGVPLSSVLNTDYLNASEAVVVSKALSKMRDRGESSGGIDGLVRLARLYLDL